MITIRNYQDTDWESISRIHDSARTLELELAGLKRRIFYRWKSPQSGKVCLIIPAFSQQKKTDR